MTTEEVLIRYDNLNRKGFDYHFITSELGALDDAQKNRPEYDYEVIAFMLVPSADSVWPGHYYGPKFRGQDVNGNMIDNPAIDTINANVVKYWKARMSKVVNPLLRFQYSNLVIDFLESTTAEKPSKEIFSNAIKSAIEIADGGYASHAIISVKYLKRAFQLSVSNDCLLKEVKDAFVAFEENNEVEDTAAGIWGVYFQLMIENQSLFSQSEVDKLIDSHEERLYRLSSRYPNSKQSPALNPHAVEQQATLLAEFYKANNRQEDVKRVLYVNEIAHKRCFPTAPGMSQMGQMQRVLQLYLNFGVISEKERLLTEIQQLGVKAKKDMQMQSFSVDLPSDKLQAFLEDLSNGSNLERLIKYVYHFMPKEEQQKKMLKESAKQYPLVYMIQNQLMDDKGHPTSIVGSIESDLDGHVALQTSRVLQAEAFLLRKATSLLQKDVLSYQSLVDHIKKSPIFETERIPIIEKGLKLLYDGDCLLATHLLLPQIEHAIAVLLETNGAPILRIKEDGKGYEIKSLNEMLQDSTVKTVIGEDGVFYLRVLLTDSRGWNIRNNVAHGITPESSFSTILTDRLIHVFVMLGFIRPKE